MIAKEIRRRVSNDLREEIKRLEKAMFDHRFRGQSEEKADRGLVRRSRRDVARILTVLGEREREAAASGGSGTSASGGSGAASPSGSPSRRVKPAVGGKE